MRPGVIVFCCDGLYQRYMIKRIAEEFRLIGVVLQVNPASKGSIFSRLSRYLNPVELIQYIAARIDDLANRKIQQKIVDQLIYEKGVSPTIPMDCLVLTTENINSQEVVKFSKNLAPDLICVNGTQLLRKPILDLLPGIPYGIINLHTGISPYTRGGNCNLFAMLEGHPEWVGVTVHYIDAGIDSGDIIRTAQVEMHDDDVYQSIDARVFHTGIELMIDAVNEVIAGNALRVKQWMEGKLYLRRTGYMYKPYYVYKVNKLIRKGLLAGYLRDKTARDKNVRLVGLLKP